MAISFNAIDDPPGLVIHDSIEQRHLQIRSPQPVSVSPAPTNGFVFPVDAACSVETTSLIFHIRCFVNIHDEDGHRIERLETGDEIHFDSATHFIGLSGPVKLYCRTDCAGTITTGLNSTKISFADQSKVRIGARSHHEQPVGTIQTPEDPESILQSISLLSSALKTTSPERAWPSLRGHPPLIKCSDEFERPSELAPPETDVEIAVSPTYKDIYTVAPLAFYLGASLHPGAENILTTPDLEYHLGTQIELEETVSRLLKQFFLLDSVVRTQGVFQIDLSEQKRLETELPFALEEAYELSLSQRVTRYLDVSYDLIRPQVPDWPLTAHVEPNAASAELVPFIVNELGIIRTARGKPITASPDELQAEHTLRRSQTLPRSPADVSWDDTRDVIVPEPTNESLEHAWFADRVPYKASKATIQALRSQLSQTERSESIDILLICNDERMLDEHTLLDDVYGDRDQLPFDIHSEFGVTTSRLESLLSEEQYDFLHFIGHARPDGLRCSDGILDIRTLDSVNVAVFFLNACQSYEQGLALARRGAFGGVSTLNEVVNEHAVEVGETVARLLNRGFPLRASLAVAQKTSAVGDEYLIVGDGSADIAQSDDGAPLIVEIEQHDDSTVEFAAHSYPTKDFKLGTVTESTLKSSADMHLSPRSTVPSMVSKEAVEEYLTWTRVPVLIDGELYWNDDIVPFTIE